MLAVFCVLSCLRGDGRMGFGLPVVFRHAGDAVAKQLSVCYSLIKKKYGMQEIITSVY